MKRIPTLILVAVLISLLIISAGAALSCKDYPIQRLPLSLTQEGEDAGHTLRSGSVTRVNFYGTKIYFTMSYKLRGAKPNTTYDICWEIEELGTLYPVTVYEGDSIQTNNRGNATLYTKGSMELVKERVYPATTLHFRVRFLEGGHLLTDEELIGIGVDPETLPPGVSLMYGGNIIFETDWFEVNFVWD